MKTLIITAYDNNMQLVGDATLESKQEYAKKHGFDFKHYNSNSDFIPEEHPSFTKLKFILNHVDSYDFIVWLDADAIITNPSINIVDDVLSKSANSYTDVDDPFLFVSLDWSSSDHYSNTLNKWSAGNMVLKCTEDLKLFFNEAYGLKAYARTPLWDQSAMKKVLSSNPIYQNKIVVLDKHVLNAVPVMFQADHTNESTWCHDHFLAHLTGAPSNTLRLAWLSDYKRGDVLGLPLSKYQAYGYDRVMAMDLLHVAFLKSCVELTEVKNVVEVGCYQGISTIAFLDAVESGQINKLHLIDTNFLRSLKHRVSLLSRTPNMHRTRSINVLSKMTRSQFEGSLLVYLDGDHSLKTCSDEYKLVAPLKPDIICLHDIREEPGPSYVLTQMQKDGYLVLTDLVGRENMRTERGIAVGFLHLDDYLKCLKAYKELL